MRMVAKAKKNRKKHLVDQLKMIITLVFRTLTVAVRIVRVRGPSRVDPPPPEPLSRHAVLDGDFDAPRRVSARPTNAGGIGHNQRTSSGPISLTLVGEIYDTGAALLNPVGSEEITRPEVVVRHPLRDLG